MTAQNEQIIKKIVVAIKRLNRAVSLGSSKISRGSGLTPSQSSVLRNLFKRGPLSSAELSRYLYVTPANITGIIDRLEKKGLVERLPKGNDRRVALIALTSDGAAQSRSLLDPIEKKLISGLAHLESQKVADLNEALMQILALIETEGSSAVLPERADAEAPDLGNRSN
jgi:DNA-binding MarR family transcriptional regulator